jgi:hypothetical protein
VNGKPLVLESSGAALMVEAGHRRQGAYLASKRLSQYNNLATTPSTRSSFLLGHMLIGIPWGARSHERRTWEAVFAYAALGDCVRQHPECR